MLLNTRLLTSTHNFTDESSRYSQEMVLGPFPHDEIMSLVSWPNHCRQETVRDKPSNQLIGSTATSGYYKQQLRFQPAC